MKRLHKKISVFSCAFLFVCSLACLLMINVRNVRAEENIIYSKSQIFETDKNISGVEDNFVLPSYCNKTTAAGQSEMGVAIYSSVSGATFTYKNEIDFSNVTKEDNLIEYYALSGDDYALMDSTTIKFTDVDDASNTVGVYIYTSSKSGTIYALVNYKGKSAGLGNCTTDYGRLLTDPYGTYCSTCFFSATGHADGSVNPFSVSLDYAEKQVYVNLKGRQSVVLDLDDPNCVGEGYEWAGFTNGKAKMSVSMSFVQAKKGGVVVKSIMGKTLDGVFATDEDYPTPEVKYLLDSDYLTTMPNAQVNTKYRLPKIYAYDWFFGECDEENISIKVYKKNGDAFNEDVSENISGEYFTPTSVGEYQIQYVVKNLKREVESALTFQAIDYVPAITITNVSDYGTPQLLTYLALPQIEYFGGSGKIECTQTLFYNGKEVELTEDRNLYIDETGYVSLKVECVDYLEKPCVRYFTIEIPDATVLSVNRVPLYAIQGETITFPAATAYDTKFGDEAAVTISVNGQTLGTDRTYTVGTDANSLAVKYTATSALGTEEKAFNIPVIGAETIVPSSYMLSENGTVNDSNNGLLLESDSSDASFSWGNPIVTGASSATAHIFMSGVNGGANFEYLDVSFANYENLSETMFVRVYRDCDREARSYIQINGVGAKYLVTGSLLNDLSPIKFYIDTEKGYLYDSVTASEICSITYKASLSIVSFSFGNVSSASTVLLQRISNQSLNYKAGSSWRDKTESVISYSFGISGTFKKLQGKTIYLPKAEAFDMVSRYSSVSLKVLDPNEEVVFSTEDTSKENSFVANKTGSYMIVYNYKDGNNNTNSAIYYCQIYENTAPVLTIEHSIAAEYKASEKLLVPEATAVDDTSGECKVYCYLQYVADGSLKSVAMGSEVSFNKAGRYKLIYYSFDEHYNYVRYEMSFEVKG